MEKKRQKMPAGPKARQAQRAQCSGCPGALRVLLKAELAALVVREFQGILCLKGPRGKRGQLLFV